MKLALFTAAGLLVGLVAGALAASSIHQQGVLEPGERELVALERDLAHLASRDGAVRSDSESLAYARGLVALSTINMGQSFDTLNLDQRRRAEQLASTISANAKLMPDGSTDIGRWSAHVRQCIERGAQQEAKQVGECAREFVKPAEAGEKAADGT